MVAPESLRILMVVDTPWDRRLGAPRVQIELAEQFAMLGHHVDHFSYEDAYPTPPLLPELAGMTRNFPRRAARHVRKHGRYDIIDAREGSLVASKKAMRFDGLLVVRSTGLLGVYEEEFLAEERRSGHRRARKLARPLRWAQRLTVARRSELALSHSDLINVLNSDEEDYCRRHLGAGRETVKFLHGLTRDRMSRFLESQAPPDRRIANPRVAFVGTWSRRKGAHDMGAIVRAVRQRIPAAQFTFLGTGVEPDKVLADLNCDRSGIEVRSRFDSDDLPELLGTATVGMLPSYVEGFPFSIIEMLGAGLPVVAYDAPGARETLHALDRSLLVARGSTDGFANRLADLLDLELDAFARLSARATQLADGLRWEQIARETIATYRDRHAALQSQIQLRR